MLKNYYSLKKLIIEQRDLKTINRRKKKFRLLEG